MSKHDDDTCPHLVRASLLEAENARLKAFSDEAQAHIAKEERKSRECLDMEQAENARLKAEVARLTKAGDRIKSLLSVSDIHSENSRLQDEVERLIKAGDRMKGLLSVLDKHSPETRWDIVKAWNAAKEGKQS